jgi:membrane-bound lytic murein transglycosylase D
MRATLRNKIFTLAIAALLQACATQPLPPEEAQQPSSVSPVFEPGAAATRPAAPAPAAAPRAQPPAAISSLPDASRLPPFDGERRELNDPLRDIPSIDRTTRPDDLWDRIRRGFGMADLNGPLVREKVTFYAARPEYLQRVFDRSRLYLFHIVEEIEKRGMPTELALLPIVESAFNPMAYSRAHASGLWQFIPGTGKRYELTQNWWYDGRRDIVASTAAALEYLNTIYEMHGDWHLALASYNWGENAVARAVAKNRAAGLATDYSSLTMPAETRHYIPKLQALKNIIRDPKTFGVDLGPIPNQPYFATVEKLKDIDVQLAAKLAEMPVEQFVALNPGFSRPIIRASVTPRIILPADRVEIFHNNLTKYNEGSLVSWQTYTPKKGETLESIAKKHGLTLGQLKEVNGISPRTRSIPSLMVVPVNVRAAASHGKMPIQYAPPIAMVVRRITHTVKPGETLVTIARRYNVTVEELRRWNAGGRLATGQKLTVEVKTAAKGKPRAKPKGKPRKKS